jgi:succinate dehydrogenase/fumarate reductase flavoprotein subunit
MELRLWTGAELLHFNLIRNKMKSTLIFVYGLTVLFAWVTLMVRANLSSDSEISHSQRQFSQPSLQEEISLIENQLKDLQAIQRMNSNSATLEERMTYEKMLTELSSLRERLLSLKIESIRNKFTAYQKEHSDRLNRFGILKKEYLN